MGYFFYVIGASGVGKDSVMEWARKKINGNDPVIFTHRYITRSAKAGSENHVALSKEEFNLWLKRDIFALNWNSHNHFYGIGKEIFLWKDHGFNVVISGSREYLAEAGKKIKDLKVILITAKPETIKERLYKRGRENNDEIRERIKRNEHLQIYSKTMIEISNDGELEEAGAEFLKIISKTD